MGKLFTNLKTDGQVTSSNPDAERDYYYITDKEKDTNHLLENIVDIVKNLSVSPTVDCQILYGGVISDSGASQIDISKGVALGKDTNGDLRLVELPAQSNIALPSGWDDDRQIWVASRYDYKLTANTRAHGITGETYNYELEDTHDGDASAENKPTNGYFYDADPGTTDYVIWGSFKMNGAVFTDLSSAERGSQFFLNPDLSSKEIQDFTVVGNVGDSLQQMAYHQLTAAELAANLSAYAPIGLFNFPATNIETDLTGNQDLTLVNMDDTNNTVGILNTNFAINFNGTDEYFTHPDAFDSVSTLVNGIGISFDIKVDDGQLLQYIMNKANDANNYFLIGIDASGRIFFTTNQAGAGDHILYAKTTLANGVNDWINIKVNWDTTNGKRIWINGRLENQAPEETTLMGDGTTNDLFTGADDTPANYYGGDMANLFLGDVVFTTRGVNFMCAIEIDEPVSLQGKDYFVYEKVRPMGDTSYEYQKLSNVVMKYNNKIYLMPFKLDPLDTRSFVGELK